MRSRAPPVTKVSLPASSTVNAESLPNVKPAANGWPGLLQEGHHTQTNSLISNVK